ncbi:MAG: hypothetical protein CMI53_05265 [Parcubacteria group bacterium]|nr:hypothetical protein [Parcubacteria group bacterium]|tara:strand:+ start:2203 stop:2724 length:522 start_codon:yes stop_codon:yes gene_type:complete
MIVKMTREEKVMTDTEERQKLTGKQLLVVAKEEDPPTFYGSPAEVQEFAPGVIGVRRSMSSDDWRNPRFEFSDSHWLWFDLATTTLTNEGEIAMGPPGCSLLSAITVELDSSEVEVGFLQFTHGDASWEELLEFSKLLFDANWYAEPIPRWSLEEEMQKMFEKALAKNRQEET